MSESAALTIALAADHRGFALKESLKSWLTEHGYQVQDFGAAALDPADDYPDFALPAAHWIAEAPAERRGIFACGSGQGVAIAANKVRGIRAIVAVTPNQELEVNGAQVLALAADTLSTDDAQALINNWLPASLEPIGDRHQRRIDKLEV